MERRWYWGGALWQAAGAQGSSGVADNSPPSLAQVSDCRLGQGSEFFARCRGCGE